MEGGSGPSLRAGAGAGTSAASDGGVRDPVETRLAALAKHGGLLLSQSRNPS